MEMDAGTVDSTDTCLRAVAKLELLTTTVYWSKGRLGKRNAPLGSVTEVRE